MEILIFMSFANCRRSNVDAQIQRCEERISKNIMPSILKGRLKLLKKRRRKER